MIDKSKLGKETDYDEMTYNPHHFLDNTGKGKPMKPASKEHLKYLDEQAEDFKNQKSNPK